MNTRSVLLASLLLAAAGSASAQSFARPKTFLNLPWGASRGEVLKAIADVGGTVPDTAYESTEPKMDLPGGKFAGQDVANWSLDFVHGKLVSAAVSLKAADGSSGVLYRQIVQELRRKYGPHPSERKYSTLTADQKKAYTAQGLRAPNRGSAVLWKFPPNLKEKDSLSLSCEHHPPVGLDTDDETQFLVTLRYAHESLKAQLGGPSGSEDKPGKTVKAKDL